MYKYQEFSRYFAQIAGGSEEIGAQELRELGAEDPSIAFRGVHFSADAATLYRINYCSRLPTRILAPLTSFNCHSADYLYRTAREVEWQDFLNEDDSFAVFANVSNSKIRHSQYAALRVKDAVVDQFRDRTGRRPAVDTRNPEVWINLYIENNHATISLGTSGGSLHRRGYRTMSGAAPMQETVAAAVIRLTGWNGERPFYDPMCGSGTLPAEALMHYCRIPAAYLRDHFGFERLPDFDVQVWQDVKTAADRQIRPLQAGLITASDIDLDAVSAARHNLRSLPFGDRVEVNQGDFRNLPHLKDVMLVVNPPYGARLGRRQDARKMIKELGDFLKQRCTGSTAFIYVGEPALLKSVGLRTTWKKPLVNGAMEGRLARYELY